MRRIHQVAGTVFLAFGLFIVWQALKLRYYTPLGPGPGFFSFWLGALLSGLAVAMILRASFGAPERPAGSFFADWVSYFRIGSLVAGLVLVVLLMKPVGYPLTMTGFAALALASGGAGWRTVLIGALLGGFGSHYVFANWLQVALPKGLFAF
jgi:putative tricarboxylic transport membrane protein